MRWLSLLIIALVALGTASPADAQRRVIREFDEFGRPIRVYRSYDYYRPYGYRAYGAPVIARRGFPRFPFDGQRVWRAGRRWQFDSALGQWIIIR